MNYYLFSVFIFNLFLQLSVRQRLNKCLKDVYDKKLMYVIIKIVFYYYDGFLDFLFINNFLIKFCVY